MNIPEVKDVESPDHVERENELIRKRVDRAWGCVLKPSPGSKASSSFQKLALDSASEEGEGLSIFRFLPPNNTAKDYNCEFYWAEKDSPPWNLMISNLPEKQAFLKAYNPGKNYAICLSVPLHAIGDETIQSIKLFDLVASKEVEW